MSLVTVVQDPEADLGALGVKGVLVAGAVIQAEQVRLEVQVVWVVWAVKEVLVLLESVRPLPQYYAAERVLLISKVELASLMVVQGSTVNFNKRLKQQIS